MSVKKVTIAGAGMGMPAGMTAELRDVLREAELVIGPGRILRTVKAEIAPPGRRFVSEYRAERIREIVDAAEETEILILVTGDQGFYSAAAGIRQELLPDYPPYILPGISSISYFSAAIGVPYSGACLASAHGRKLNIASAARRNPVTFVLSGGNLKEMLGTLCEFGYGELEVFTGENLSYHNERILHGTAEKLSRETFDGLSLMAVLNPDADESVPVGIPDEAFVRGSVPMTKRAARAFIVSSLGIRSDSVICDIGAGTGSVSVEAALAAYKGTVYAIEKKPEAVELIRRNAVRFHTDNLRIIEGEAPGALSGIPEADAYFIGGSSGHLESMIESIRWRGKGKKKVVISAVTVQTLSRACSVLEGTGAADISYAQIVASHSNKVGNYDMMKAENPVFIISADL